MASVNLVLTVQATGGTACWFYIDDQLVPVGTPVPLASGIHNLEWEILGNVGNTMTLSGSVAGAQVFKRGPYTVTRPNFPSAGVFQFTV